MTGVIPLPAVRKSALRGAGVGRVNSPVAWSSWMSVPGRSSRTTWLLTLPPSMALTVIEIVPSGEPRGEVIE
jgi:hypothetical protein